MSIFEINNVDWFNSISKTSQILTVIIPCVVICLWVQYKFYGKALRGFSVVDCEDHEITIPQAVLLIFIFPPFFGVLFVFIVILQPLASLLFAVVAVLIFFLWFLAGAYAQAKK